MDSKTPHVLEYPKILERLKSFCDFSASEEQRLEWRRSIYYNVPVDDFLMASLE